MKILFALNQELNNLELRILREYEKEYDEIFEFDRAVTVDEILNKAKNFDILILNEELEANNPITFKEIEDIKSINTSIRIILLANSENKGEEFIEKLNNIEIFDIMFSDDISIENIIFLIKNPKTKEEDLLNYKINIKKTTNIKESKKNNDNINQPKEIIYKEKLLNTQIIGIGTAQRGAGSTYHSLSISNYLASLNFKVAIVEITENSGLNLIDSNMLKKPVNIFAFKKLEASQQKIIVLCNEQEYDYIVCDFGVIFNHEYYSEFLRANFKILISLGDIWHTNSINKIQTIPNVQTERFPIIINFSNNKNISKNANYIYSSEYNVDIFNPTESQKELYNKLLKPILPKEIRAKRNKVLNWRD